MSNTPEEAIRHAVNTIFISATDLVTALPRQAAKMFGMTEADTRAIVADETTGIATMLIQVMEKMKNERSSS